MRAAVADTGTELVERYVLDRRTLISSARPGPDAARSLSDRTDSAVSALAETALSSLGVPWAVLALGGWGARRLLPGSDLDLLVIVDADPAALRPALSAVLYPLWDAGLQVGHQVRTRREHLRACRADVETLTATLTGRVLAGDRDLGEAVTAAAARGAHGRSRRLTALLASRTRPGSPYLLEPDLKSGAGGQRDLDEMTWTAAVLAGAPVPDHTPLVRLGLLEPDEAGLLSRAAETITTARWEVHVRTGRSSSVLTLDIADEVGRLAEWVQTALADVHHLLLRVRARAAGMVVRTGMRGPVSARALEAALLASDAEAILEEAAWSRRLDDLVPGMSDLLTLRRPGLSHTRTVGAHCIRTAALLAQREDVSSLPDAIRRPLLVAGLLHDVGKVHRGPGHETRGARMAATLAPRFGLSPREARDLATLVREHLLLTVTASTEDIHDEDVILRVAGRLRDPHVVTALSQLAAADGEATGPGTWTPWSAALVGELAERVTAALDEESHGAGLAVRAEAHRREALRLLATDEDDAAAAVVRAASVRQLASHRPAEVAAHARLVVAASVPGAPPQSAVSPGRAAGTWRVSVSAPDRSGLFAALAGALTLSGLAILSAEAYAAPGGIALDVFVVRPDTLAEIDAWTWARFERHLGSALVDPRGTDARIAGRRAHYTTDPVEDPLVTVEPTGAYATALHVSATDRVGLLHDIARAIEETGLDVRWARATTRGRRALDVFHITDRDGEPVTDAGVLGHLSMRIRTRVGA